MRLIDGDALLERVAEYEAFALQMVEKTKYYEDKIEWEKWSVILRGISAFKSDLIDTPTVDAIPVVKCKNCRYAEGESISDGRLWCGYLKTYMSYCSEGDYREEGK